LKRAKNGSSQRTLNRRYASEHHMGST